LDRTILAFLAVGSTGYLLGSCPNGLLISNALGIDIRKQGSGNIGATNVLRVAGKKWGYIVFTLDALKGLLAVLLAALIGTALEPLSEQVTVFEIVAGVACILGHTFPFWLRFRGGKGVATSAGVLLGIMPIAILSVFAVWWLVFKVTRIVSVASIAAAISLPIFTAAYLHFTILSANLLLPFSILIATVVVWRHRSNIQRLVRGAEEPFDQK
jgi:glycerol-3-phosphate acyltransferase PlsY